MNEAHSPHEGDEMKRPLKSSSHIWENNINKDIKEEEC
jgi:hypothetical protein